TIEVNGVGKCSGACAAQELEVNGVLKCGGSVRADRAEINGTLNCIDRLDVGEMEIDGAVKVDGVARVEGDLEVDGVLDVDGEMLECGRVECDGALKVKGNITAKTMEVDGSLSAKGDIAADEIEVDGVLKVGGQVSADKVHVEGCISASEIVGDEVVIWNQHRNTGFTITVGESTIIRMGSTVFNNGSTTSSRLGLIEATTIALAGVEADTVNGTDVTIGPGCVINHLDCNGILRIDPAARVGNITGEYTWADE
ncbi:MAG: polymer-forming cytoskeletal protein, partial [Oscillospiraceae bacterium]|nr:polymer-forming cytoskeletal protein [Oscillospiraceae bacterium]